MSTINRIREALAEQAPAHLDHATETSDGVVISLNNKSGWNRLSEERELTRRLAPLADKGWTIKAGPKNFRSGTSNEIIVTPPVVATGIDTATLALRDRIRIEGRVQRKGGLTDYVDRLEVNEEDGTVSFNTGGLPRYNASLIEELAYTLRAAGWDGAIGRRFGQAGLYGTLTAPERGQTVPQAQIDAYTA